MAVISNTTREILGCGVYDTITEQNNELYRSVTSIKVTPGDPLPTVTLIGRNYQAIDGAWVAVNDDTEFHFTLTPDA